MRRTVAAAVTALAVVAFAGPTLACGWGKSTTASAPQTVADAEKPLVLKPKGDKS